MALNEFELIRLLCRDLPGHPALVAGPGDDCAVLDLGIPGRVLLFKTDAVVAGIHFTAEAPPEQVGRKALARCLSDIAAMAGTPVAALVTLALPETFDAGQVEKMYAGMNALARQHGVAIAGGETTTNPERMLISIAMIGTAASGRCPRRSGAKPGDAIFVTGELGGSIAGKHLDFEPRLAEGAWLAEHFDIHAMMDVSDGLAGDLRHILRASGVGAELLEQAIPISQSAKIQARQPGGKPELLAALSDGEDFELLFTVAARDAVAVLDSWKQRFPQTRLSCIGKITVEQGLRLRDRDGVREMGTGGYAHFSNSNGGGR